MLVAILSSIPIWVFPLFLGLALLGARAMREREVPVLLIYAMPLLGLLSLHRARELAEADLALTLLAVSWVIGVAAGFALQSRWTLGRTAKRVRLAGEWVTMLCLMGLFLANFAVGMVEGMAPGLADGAGFAAGFALVAGGLSGILAGRGLRVGLTPLQPAG